MEEKIYDILVIGGGSAGITAGIYAKRAGRDVAIFEKFALGGQLNLIGEIENYTGFAKIEGPELAQKFKEHAKSIAVPIIKEDAIEFKLDSDIKEVKTKKNVYKARAIIFAMGSHPRELGIEGEEQFKGRGVSYCALCDGNFFKNKQVAVVGSGDSAFSDALYLAGICSQVYVLTKDTLKMHNYAENEFKNKTNVTVLKGALSQSIEGKESVEKLTYIQNGKLDSVYVDGVFVAIGRTPDTNKLRGQISLDEKGYILVNSKQETNIEGVYACGDVTSNIIKQISTAVGQGAIAGTEATKYVLIAKRKSGL